MIIKITCDDDKENEIIIWVDEKNILREKEKIKKKLREEIDKMWRDPAKCRVSEV